jgi:hypothetical protein
MVNKLVPPCNQLPATRSFANSGHHDVRVLLCLKWLTTALEIRAALANSGIPVPTAVS